MSQYDHDCPRCRGGGCEWCQNTGKRPVTISDNPERRTGRSPIRVKPGETLADALAAPRASLDSMLMPLSDVNDLDAVVHALGIEDSDTTPAEAVAELKAELTALRADITNQNNIIAAWERENNDLRADIATYVQVSADQQGEIERLRAALTTSVAGLDVSAAEHHDSAGQFTFYAQQHLAKRPPDSAKALTNNTHAARCTDAQVKARAARDAAKAALEGGDA